MNEIQPFTYALTLIMKCKFCENWLATYACIRTGKLRTRSGMFHCTTLSNTMLSQAMQTPYYVQVVIGTVLVSLFGPQVSIQTSSERLAHSEHSSTFTYIKFLSGRMIICPSFHYFPVSNSLPLKDIKFAYLLPCHNVEND